MADTSAVPSATRLDALWRTWRSLDGPAQALQSLNFSLQQWRRSTQGALGACAAMARLQVPVPVFDRMLEPAVPLSLAAPHATEALRVPSEAVGAFESPLERSSLAQEELAESVRALQPALDASLLRPLAVWGCAYESAWERLSGLDRAHAAYARAYARQSRARILEPDHVLTRAERRRADIISRYETTELHIKQQLRWLSDQALCLQQQALRVCHASSGAILQALSTVGTQQLLAFPVALLDDTSTPAPTTASSGQRTQQHNRHRRQAAPITLATAVALADALPAGPFLPPHTHTDTRLGTAPHTPVATPPSPSPQPVLVAAPPHTPVPHEQPSDVGVTSSVLSSDLPLTLTPDTAVVGTSLAATSPVPAATTAAPEPITHTTLTPDMAVVCTDLAVGLTAEPVGAVTAALEAAPRPTLTPDMAVLSSTDPVEAATTPTTCPTHTIAADSTAAPLAAVSGAEASESLAPDEAIAAVATGTSTVSHSGIGNDNTGADTEPTAARDEGTATVSDSATGWADGDSGTGTPARAAADSGADTAAVEQSAPPAEVSADAAVLPPGAAATGVLVPPAVAGTGGAVLSSGAAAAADDNSSIATPLHTLFTTPPSATPTHPVAVSGPPCHTPLTFATPAATNESALFTAGVSDQPGPMGPAAPLHNLSTPASPTAPATSAVPALGASGQHAPAGPALPGLVLDSVVIQTKSEAGVATCVTDPVSGACAGVFSGVVVGGDRWDELRQQLHGISASATAPTTTTHTFTAPTAPTDTAFATQAAGLTGSAGWQTAGVQGEPASPFAAPSAAAGAAAGTTPPLPAAPAGVAAAAVAGVQPGDSVLDLADMSAILLGDSSSGNGETGGDTGTGGAQTSTNAEAPVSVGEMGGVRTEVGTSLGEAGIGTGIVGFDHGGATGAVAPVTAAGGSGTAVCTYRAGSGHSGDTDHDSDSGSEGSHVGSRVCGLRDDSLVVEQGVDRQAQDSPTAPVGVLTAAGEHGASSEHSGVPSEHNEHTGLSCEHGAISEHSGEHSGVESETDSDDSSGSSTDGNSENYTAAQQAAYEYQTLAPHNTPVPDTPRGNSPPAIDTPQHAQHGERATADPPQHAQHGEDGEEGAVVAALIAGTASPPSPTDDSHTLTHSHIAEAHSRDEGLSLLMASGGEGGCDAVTVCAPREGPDTWVTTTAPSSVTSDEGYVLVDPAQSPATSPTTPPTIPPATELLSADSGESGRGSEIAPEPLATPETAAAGNVGDSATAAAAVAAAAGGGDGDGSVASSADSNASVRGSEVPSSEPLLTMQAGLCEGDGQSTGGFLTPLQSSPERQHVVPTAAPAPDGTAGDSSHAEEQASGVVATVDSLGAGLAGGSDVTGVQPLTASEQDTHSGVLATTEGLGAGYARESGAGVQPQAAIEQDTHAAMGSAHTDSPYPHIPSASSVSDSQCLTPPLGAVTHANGQLDTPSATATATDAAAEAQQQQPTTAARAIESSEAGTAGAADPAAATAAAVSMVATETAQGVGQDAMGAVEQQEPTGALFSSLLRAVQDDDATGTAAQTPALDWAQRTHTASVVLPDTAPGASVPASAPAQPPVWSFEGGTSETVADQHDSSQGAEAETRAPAQSNDNTQTTDSGAAMLPEQATHTTLQEDTGPRSAADSAVPPIISYVPPPPGTSGTEPAAAPATHADVPAGEPPPPTTPAPPAATSSMLEAAAAGDELAGVLCLAPASPVSPPPVGLTSDVFSGVKRAGSDTHTTPTPATLTPAISGEARAGSASVSEGGWGMALPLQTPEPSPETTPTPGTQTPMTSPASATEHETRHNSATGIEAAAGTGAGERPRYATPIDRGHQVLPSQLLGHTTPHMPAVTEATVGTGEAGGVGSVQRTARSHPLTHEPSSDPHSLAHGNAMSEHTRAAGLALGMVGGTGGQAHSVTEPGLYVAPIDRGHQALPSQLLLPHSHGGLESMQQGTDGGVGADMSVWAPRAPVRAPRAAAAGSATSAGVSPAGTPRGSAGASPAVTPRAWAGSNASAASSSQRAGSGSGVSAASGPLLRRMRSSRRRTEPVRVTRRSALVTPQQTTEERDGEQR